MASIPMKQLESIATDDLARAHGGARRQQQQHSNPFGFLDGAYKGIVFNVASGIGGTKLANTMYGKSTTASDRARAQAAFKQFLVAGNKLPKGVPNLFG
jgi:hypothetical protein